MFLYTLSVSASVKQSREERVARSSTLYGLLYDALLFKSCLLWAREVECYSYQKKKREVKCYCDIPTLEAELLLGLLLDFDLKSSVT